jgi:hypothetical protein
VISKIAPGSITTYDGQILDANIITLRVKNGYLFWKPLVQIIDTSYLQINDVIHFIGTIQPKFFYSREVQKTINQITISNMIEWEMIGEMDPIDAKTSTADGSVLEDILIKKATMKKTAAKKKTLVE